MSERGSSEVVKRKELVARLNLPCQRAFKAAGDSAKLRGNPYVELVHFVEQLALLERGDVQLILAEAGVDGSRLAADMTAAIDALPRGATAISAFSDHIFEAIHAGMSYGALQARDETVRSAYILLGALKVPALDGLLGRISRELDKVDPDALGPRLDAVLVGLDRGERRRRPPRRRRRPRRGGARRGTARWPNTRPTSPSGRRAGKIDPVVGRDPEIRQIVDVLMRRRQNNPILTGEAGVGKTAVVEGFALRIAAGRRAADAAGRAACACSTSG